MRHQPLSYKRKQMLMKQHKHTEKQLAWLHNPDKKHPSHTLVPLSVLLHLSFQGQAKSYLLFLRLSLISVQ